MKRHLVIGASGQLGIELIIGLQERYGVDAVVATDIRQGNDEQANRSQFMFLDATNEAAVRQVISEGSFEIVLPLSCNAFC